ncbi:MAG TPA: hypothetical protein VHG72_13980 [Polyangia bacterium]|nr:hypothetical protein [Polyangia bacterium]
MADHPTPWRRFKNDGIPAWSLEDARVVAAATQAAPEMLALLREEKAVCEQVEAAREEAIGSAKWTSRGLSVGYWPPCEKCRACRVLALLDRIDKARPAPATRNCLRCGASFYDDGNTWCPSCDGQNGLRVYELRRWYQENLKAGRPQHDPTGKPDWA